MKYHPAVRKMDIKFPCPGLWGMRLLCPVLGSELVKTVWCVNFYSSQGNSLPRHNVSYSKLLVWRMLRAAELKTQRRGQKNSIRQTSLCQTPSLQNSLKCLNIFLQQRQMCRSVWGPVWSCLSISMSLQGAWAIPALLSNLHLGNLFRISSSLSGIRWCRGLSLFWVSSEDHEHQSTRVWLGLQVTSHCQLDKLQCLCWTW